MFLIGEQDFVAGFKIEAIGDEAHRFGGVVGEGEFGFRGAEEFGKGGAVRLHGLVAPARVLIGGVSGALGEIVVGRFDDAIGGGPDAAGVEIGAPVGEGEVILTDFEPARIVIGGGGWSRKG